MTIQLVDVLGDPAAVAEQLRLTNPDICAASSTVNPDEICFDLTLQPWHSLRGADPAFPVERVRILVRKDGTVAAYPVGPERPWRHQFLVDPEWRSGRLCLFFEGDLSKLRWDWSDGFECYVGIVHRHLIFEEWARRGNPWPVEEAPHGHGDHPIRTLRMQAAAGLRLRLPPQAEL